MNINHKHMKNSRRRNCTWSEYCISCYIKCIWWIIYLIMSCNSAMKMSKTTHTHTHLEWFSPSVTAIRQIPWQVSMSPFWTASLSCSWRASTWGTSFSKVFTYLQNSGHTNTDRQTQELTVKSQAWVKTRHRLCTREKNITCTASKAPMVNLNLTQTAHSKDGCVYCCFFKTSVSNQISVQVSSTSDPAHPPLKTHTSTKEQKKSIQSCCSELRCCQLLFCLVPAVSAI